MEAYYSRQAALPHFSGHYRQRGRGFGALAAGIGRFALPFARKVIWPAAKAIGKELFTQSVPEIADVITKKKTPKQAVRSAVKKTNKKQLGSCKVTKRKRAPRRQSPRISKRKRSLRRSRSDFFAKVKNDS